MRIIELKGYKGICMTDDNGNYYELRKIEVPISENTLEEKIVKFIKNLGIAEMDKKELFGLLKENFGSNDVKLGVILKNLGYKSIRKQYRENGKKYNGKAFFYNLDK